MAIVVALGSKNPMKVAGVRRGFEKVFPDTEISILTMEAESGVPHQPMSFEETLLGARNRLQQADKAFPEADYCVAVESGIFAFGPNAVSSTAIPLDVHAVLIEDRHGVMSVGFSQLFLVPPSLMYLLRGPDDLGLGGAANKYYGKENSKFEGGFCSLYTNGLITRDASIEQAVIYALMKFFNPKMW